jgi:hypothetical protein
MRHKNRPFGKCQTVWSAENFRFSFGGSVLTLGCWTGVKCRAMLSSGERTRIKAEIERLEKAFKECTDNGIGEAIKAWIADLKKELAAGTKKGS